MIELASKIDYQWKAILVREQLNNLNFGKGLA